MLKSYAPHSLCLLRDARLIDLMEFANGLIVTAYFLIPLCLTVLLVGLATSEDMRKTIRHRLYIQLATPGNFLIGVRKAGLLLSLFAAFIFLCGCTHILDIIVLFRPVYWQQALVLLLTGLVSMATATVLLFTVYRVIKDGRSERHRPR